MLYHTSRLYSPIQFDNSQDPQLLESLVSKLEQVDDWIWKIWTITDIFRTDLTEYYVASTWQGWWQQTEEMVSQNTASYLRVEQSIGQTTFTIVSVSQSALQNLQALIANLYEPVTPAGLDGILEQNQDTPLQLVELIDSETGVKVRQTFIQPTPIDTLRSIRSQYPLPRWELLNLSFPLQINEPASVLGLQIKALANQAVFRLDKEEQFLSRSEFDQVHNLLSLADMAFGGLVMPVGA